MELHTSRFGAIEVDPAAIITFTQPIIGFQEYRRYVRVPGPADSVVMWLQSVDSADLAFLMMDPRHVVADYQVTLGAHELSELAVSSVAELEVYTLVVVPNDPAEVRTNLKAPIVINPRQCLAKQAVLERSDYPIQFFLAQVKAGAQEQQEVSNACSDA